MDFNKLPQELKEHPYWCLWKYETVDRRKTVVRRRPRNGVEKTTLLEGYRLQDCQEFLQ